RCLLGGPPVHTDRRGSHAGPDRCHARAVQGAPAGAVLPERAVQDRQHDVDVAEGRGRVRRGYGQGFCHGAVGARAELPLPVAADRDGRDLVLLRIEPFEHGPRGRERDLMLARAAAREHRDADPGRHQGVSLPTTIVTVEPCGACVFPSGFCVSTMPSCEGSIVCCVSTRTLKPDACSSLCAVFWSWLVTSGTVEVFGPLDTLSVMVVPAGSDAPALGVGAMTVAFGGFDGTT